MNLRVVTILEVMNGALLADSQNILNRCKNYFTAIECILGC
jgi:hypothetical protein